MQWRSEFTRYYAQMIRACWLYQKEANSRTHRGSYLCIFSIYVIIYVHNAYTKPQCQWIALFDKVCFRSIPKPDVESQSYAH